MSEKSVLSILLAHDVPEPQTKKMKIRRLSQLYGEDVVITIKELPYSTVADIRNLDEYDVHTVLAGVTDIDFKNAELKSKYGAQNPAELVKKMFQPGEIADIAREIERLSGYRTITLETVEDAKKNSGKTQNSV